MIGRPPQDMEQGSKLPIRVPLGPFDLLAPIGRGGMGEVWRGVHRAQGTPVAVKVLTSERARSPRAIAAFRAEVRAVAGLSHPSVVWVFDQGLIPEDAARRSGGRLPAGSPVLAMELADGTAEPLCGRLAWPELRALLEDVLSGLAHAHARGVVHRDIKPANLLIGGQRSGVRLTDFGLAWSHDVGDEALGGLSGTPAYMAPEQLEGDWRSYGPWTDLYALGCLAWCLSTGEPPRGRVDLLGARAASRRGLLPALRPTHAIPAGFEGWLLRLLEPEPGQRFSRAADAAVALAALGPANLGPAPATTLRELAVLSTASLAFGPDASSLAPQTAAWEPSFSVVGEASAVPHSTCSSWVPDVEVVAPAAPRTVVCAPLVTPPFPPRWQDADRSFEPPPGLLGAGLGLFGLRAVSLVGREAERETLWSALGQVHHEGRPGLVILRGPSGVGKSGLVRWISERSHESGLGTPMLAVHSPVPGPGDGVVPMVVRALKLSGATQTEVRAALTARWPELGVDPDALAEAIELLAPDEATGRLGLDDLPRVRLSGQRERHLALARLLSRLGRERPLVLALDDVQWGLEAIEFASFLAKDEAGAALRVLILATARAEALPERPDEASRLAAFSALPGARVIELGPLSPLDHRALVQQLLGFEHHHAHQLAELTAGNPLFAVQLVSDWVARGLVEVGDDGFRLKPGADLTLPSDVLELWTARLDLALGGRPAADRLALEIAAALGQDVDDREWGAVCAAAGLLVSADLTHALAERGLLRSDSDRRSDRWSFSHGMLRECVLRGASLAGRRAGHHADCAHVLEAAGGDPGRVALHLLEAGDPFRAAALLERALTAAVDSGDVPRSLTLLAAQRRALDDGGAPPDDHRRVALAYAEALVARLCGDVERCRALTAALADESARHGWARGRVLSLHLRISDEEERGRPAEAQVLVAQLGRLRIEDPELEVRLCVGDASCRAQLGDLDGAAEALVRGRALAREHGLARLGLSLLAQEILVTSGRSDDPEVFMPVAEELLQASRREGNRYYEIQALRYLACGNRLQGERETAIALLLRAERLCALMGLVSAGDLLRMDRAFLLVELGRYLQGLTELQLLLEQAAIRGRNTRMIGFLRLWAGVALAGLGRWAEVEREIGEGLERVREGGFTVLDVPRGLVLAAGLAEQAGHPALARCWWREAAEEFIKCERVDLASEATRNAEE